MLKYADTQVVFREIPDEITLAINISNCLCHCKFCHSPHLLEDIGEELTKDSLRSLIENNTGITCLCFMGGDRDPNEINELAKFIRNNFPDLKIAWYSGRQELSDKINLANFDFLKLGPYIEALGSLDKPTTNQRFYIITHNSLSIHTMVDKTYKFWKHE